DPLLILGIGIIVVVGGIIGLRLHAFLALLFGAFVVAILTTDAAIIGYVTTKGGSIAEGQQLAAKHPGFRIATAFGETCGKIGILIAMASIIGKSMLESGAAEKIVRSTLRITGLNRAPITFLGSSFLSVSPYFLIQCFT